MRLSLRTGGNGRMKWVQTGEGNVSWMSSGQTAGLNRRREASVGGGGGAGGGDPVAVASRISSTELRMRSR